jgi:aminoglycoside phosphotransferase (APT) family kinase protein
MQEPERHEPIIVLDLPALAALLAPALPGCRLASAELLGGGYINSNYLVRFVGEHAPVVVRVHAGDAEVARKEWAVAQLVRGRVPVPEPIYADFAGSRIAQPYSVLAWVDGMLLNDMLARGDGEAIGACAYAAGQTLAAVHTFTFPQAGFLGADLAVRVPLSGTGMEWQEYISSCIITGHGARWLGAERAERLWRFVQAHRTEVDAASNRAVLGHADYKGQNLLVRQTASAWQIAAVLDWEFAFAGSPLFDIGIFLRTEAEQPPAYAAQFIQGYCAAGGTLPPNWHRLCKLLDLVNLCEFLNTPEYRPVRVAEVTRHIDALLSL